MICCDIYVQDRNLGDVNAHSDNINPTTLDQHDDDISTLACATDSPQRVSFHCCLPCGPDVAMAAER